MTNENRLILANQFKILALLDPDYREEYDTNLRILQNGFVNEYSELFGELSEETSIEVIREVNQIITMYRYMRHATDVLTPEEKEEHADLLDKIKFRGFDGNHDDHYAYFQDLVERPDDFQDISNWPVNSHNQSDLDRYHRMLQVSDQILAEPNYRWGLPELQRIGAAV